MSVRCKVIAYIELARPHNLVATVITTLIGWLAVYVITGRCAINPLYPVLTVVLVAASGYVINDYFDAEVDAINKPYRPIPSGRVSRREALILSIALLVPAIIMPLLSGPISLAFVVLNAALLFAYSYKIKELGLLGNLVVAFEGAASIIYGGLSLAEALNTIGKVCVTFIPAAYAFLLLLGREIVKTIEDYRADALRNVRSLPRIIGIKASSLISSTLLLLVVLISPIPYLMLNYGVPYMALAALTDAIILYSIFKLLCIKELTAERIAAKIRSYLKVAIFIGSLAFLIDLLMRVVMP